MFTFTRLRRFEFIDRTFKTIESYTSLTQQYPLVKQPIKWLFHLAAPAVVGGWAILAEFWILFGITVGLGAFVALAFLPAAVHSLGRMAIVPPPQQPAAPVTTPPNPTSPIPMDEYMYTISLNILHIERMRLREAIIDKQINKTPIILRNREIEK
jgi:hypothetical protein